MPAGTEMMVVNLSIKLRSCYSDCAWWQLSRHWAYHKGLDVLILTCWTDTRTFKTLIRSISNTSILNP